MLSYAFQHEDFVSYYTVSPDGTILASAAAKLINNEFVPVITLWDTSSSTELNTLVVSDPVTALSSRQMASYWRSRRATTCRFGILQQGHC